jgi:hypothetical protein
LADRVNTAFVQTLALVHTYEKITETVSWSSFQLNKRSLVYICGPQSSPWSGRLVTEAFWIPICLSTRHQGIDTDPESHYIQGDWYWPWVPLHPRGLTLTLSPTTYTALILTLSPSTSKGIDTDLESPHQSRGLILTLSPTTYTGLILTQSPTISKGIDTDPESPH